MEILLAPTSPAPSSFSNRLAAQCITVARLSNSDGSHVGGVMASIASTDSLVLDLPPSCVEFWPLDPQYAVVGTYNLERSNENEEKTGLAAEKLQSRNGSLILIHVHGSSV